MQIKDFSPETQDKITKYAAKRGVSTEEVVERFEKLFHGRGVSKHSRKIFV